MGLCPYKIVCFKTTDYHRSVPFPPSHMKNMI